MVLGTHSYPFLLVLWISKIPSKHNIYITQVLIDSRMSHSTLLCAASEVELMHCILPLIHIGRELSGWCLKKKKKKPICSVALCPLFQISVTDPSMLV